MHISQTRETQHSHLYIYCFSFLYEWARSFFSLFCFSGSRAVIRKWLGSKESTEKIVESPEQTEDVRERAFGRLEVVQGACKELRRDAAAQIDQSELVNPNQRRCSLARDLSLCTRKLAIWLLTLNSRSFLQLIFLWDCLRGVSLSQLLQYNLVHHTDIGSRLIHYVFPRRREAAHCERQQEALYNTKPTFSRSYL